MRPYSAYQFSFSKNIPDSDIARYQEVACKDPDWAYYFARDVPSANISYCQKSACRTHYWSDYFAKYVPEADVEYCYNQSVGEVREAIYNFVLHGL